MSATTYQTITLSRGKHHTPDDGACVMELASMLAGEDFSDHPLSVCPVIGALLRAHNDSIDDDRRQDLYAYASTVVGSRSSGAVQDARAARLSEWDRQVRRRQKHQPELPWGLRTLGRMLRAMLIDSHAHAFYRLTVHDGQTHAEVLGLVDELLAITPERLRAPAAAGAPDVPAGPPVPSPR